MSACSFCGKTPPAVELHAGRDGSKICQSCVSGLASSTPPAFKPIPGRVLPRFAGVSTFFRLPHWEQVKGADVAILGVPFDGGTSYRPGARFAPRAIRAASVMGRGFQTGTRADIFQ